MTTADNKGPLQELIGDDFRLQWVIGRGGMSTVWLADDVRHDREVALKVLRPEFSDNSEFLHRFRHEASAAQTINSDNVVKTYDYRELTDPSGASFCFIVMEYIRGESLADLLAREGSLPVSLALDVLEQAAHGLSIIHRMGLVHRDIKPGNLLITQDGQVKITDFGIAKAATAVPLTRTGMVVGTAQYVSPEQAQGREVTPASDVYSLGVVGYEMLAGERPFTGDSSVSVALAHISQAPEPMSTSIPAEARELIGITLRKDPATRFADGNEMALAVSAVRLGKRPPQPQSAALTEIAPEPSPTAATQMLGDATHPTTIHPAAPFAPDTGTGTAAAAAAAGAAAAGAVGVGPGYPAGQPGQPGYAGYSDSDPDGGRRGSESSAGRNFGIGILLALLAAALVGGGFWAATKFAGNPGGAGSESTTPQAPVIVTEWVSPTESPEPSSPTTQPPTTQEQPPVVTVTETPSPVTTSPAEPTTTAPTTTTAESGGDQGSPTPDSPTTDNSPTVAPSIPDGPVQPSNPAGDGGGNLGTPTGNSGSNATGTAGTNDTGINGAGAQNVGGF